MIRLERLSLQVGRSWALHEISLELAPGGVLGLIGPSGSGKTLLLRVLATLLTPTTGAALINGHNVTTHPSRVRQLIGFLPDQGGYYESLKVAEYLQFYGNCQGLSRSEQERQIDNLLTLVNLVQQRHTYIEALSRSARQRLGLARCLLRDPALLLLDDPAAGLDPDEQQELWALLAHLKALGKTMVIATHQLAALGELCTHVAGLRSGRCLYVGPVPGDLDQFYREIAGPGGGAA